MKGQKTGGRQKGTPNKLTASMKYLTKALFLNNYELLEQSFQQCKPAERLNFYAKMQPYLCARETSNDNGGEWTIGQNMEHESIQQIELESLYQKQQNIELNYINALSNFQKTANERWNDIKEQMAAAQAYGVDQEKLNNMFQNLFEQFTQQYEQNHERLQNSFEKTRQSIQAKINEQENLTGTKRSNNESNTAADDPASASTESATQNVESNTQHIESTTPSVEPTTPTVGTPTPTEQPTTLSDASPTPAPTQTCSTDTFPMPKDSTNERKSVSPPQSTSNHKHPATHVPFYANLKQKRKQRRCR